MLGQHPLQSWHIPGKNPGSTSWPRYLGPFGVLESPFLHACLGVTSPLSGLRGLDLLLEEKPTEHFIEDKSAYVVMYTLLLLGVTCELFLLFVISLILSSPNCRNTSGFSTDFRLGHLSSPFQ